MPKFATQNFPDRWTGELGVGDFSGLVSTLEEQGYPFELHQVREGHAWDNWRGLADEMLIYFFGV